MSNEELMEKILQLKGSYDFSIRSDSHERIQENLKIYFLTLQFVKTYFGKDTVFYEKLKNVKRIHNSPYYDERLQAFSVLNALQTYLENNLEFYKSEAYRIETDSISDFLNQAISLANDKKYHPAAAAIIAGAEFLKLMCEKHEVDISELKNPSLDTLAQELKKVDVINK